jgi:hypothetical protein
MILVDEPFHYKTINFPILVTIHEGNTLTLQVLQNKPGSYEYEWNSEATLPVSSPEMALTSDRFLAVQLGGAEVHLLDLELISQTGVPSDKPCRIVLLDFQVKRILARGKDLVLLGDEVIQVWENCEKVPFINEARIGTESEVTLATDQGFL